ncbi:MAG: hypothetical protein WA902_21330 [Thermosynechococcaceae cyanobacterium]
MTQAASGERSPYLNPIMETSKKAGYDVNLTRVPYELQKGGNPMLVIC